MGLNSVLLLITTLLTGFLGGIGFLNFMGFNPAMKATPARDIVVYWQSLDGYMRVRMPIFGMILLVFFIPTGVLLCRQNFKLPFVFLLLSLTLVLIDFWIATRYNFPFNKMVQSITVENIPDSFERLRSDAAYGFNLRAICMLGSFVMTLTALFFQTSRGLQR